jgi:hypothetical protein
VVGGTALRYGVEDGHAERRAGVPLRVHRRDVLAVQCFDAGDAEHAGATIHGAFEARAGAVAVLALPSTRSRSRSRAASTCSPASTRPASAGAAGRRASYDGPWTDAVRRSALALDLLADDGTGAIAAAATMGLPERIGGARNYDCRYAWLRDANLTLEAMLALGCRDQVHVSLGWMLRTIRRTQPRLRPMYRLDGDPALPVERLDLAGYRGSRPVVLGNSARDQLQLGNYGDVFDMTHHYVEDGHALAPEEGRRLAEAADFLCRVWQRPDAGLWELPREREYTQSKLAAWIALDRAVRLADAGELPSETAGRWLRERSRIAGYLERRCWSDSTQAYARAAGSDELDASVLLAGRGAWLRSQPERFVATIDAVRRELGAGAPLLSRYSGMQDEEGAFLACSFWLADALARAGRPDDAAAVMDELIAFANDVGLFSEEIDPVSGDFLGNLPQALTHLALVNAAIASATRPSGAELAERDVGLVALAIGAAYGDRYRLIGLETREDRCQRVHVRRRPAVDGDDDLSAAQPGLVSGPAVLDADDHHAAAGDCGSADAERGAPGFRHLAVLDQLLRDRLDRVARDREADAGRLRAAELRIGGRERRDPDEAGLEVDERAAAVAGVDGRAGLDRRADRDAVRALADRPAERADDSLGDARAQTERVAERHHDVPDIELGRVADRHRLQPGRVGADDREVTGDPAPDERRGHLLAGGESDREPLRALDDVRIGDDVAVTVEHDAGAEPAARRDLHHRRRHLVHHAVIGRLQRDGRIARRRGRLVVAAASAPGDGERQHGKQRGDQRRHASRATPAPGRPGASGTPADLMTAPLPRGPIVPGLQAARPAALSQHDHEYGRPYREGMVKRLSQAPAIDAGPRGIAS